MVVIKLSAHMTSLDCEKHIGDSGKYGSIVAPLLSGGSKHKAFKNIITHNRYHETSFQDVWMGINKRSCRLKQKNE